MKQLVLTGWNFTRALYVIMGTVIIVQAIMDKQWMEMIFGGYFASMGLFGFGCASGLCSGASCKTEQNKNNLTEIRDLPLKK